MCNTFNFVIVGYYFEEFYGIIYLQVDQYAKILKNIDFLRKE